MVIHLCPRYGLIVYEPLNINMYRFRLAQLYSQLSIEKGRLHKIEKTKPRLWLKGRLKNMDELWI